MRNIKPNNNFLKKVRKLADRKLILILMNVLQGLEKHTEDI